MTAIRWKSDLIANFDSAIGDMAGGWTSDAGQGVMPTALPFNSAEGSGRSPSAVGGEMTKGPKLTTLVDFTGADGAFPIGGSLMTDAAGDLFGEAPGGGATGYGTVFEIIKMSTGAEY